MSRNAHQYCCVGTGFIVLDVIRNSIERGSPEIRTAGGSCGNVMAILAYLGWNANPVGRIGDDRAGRELIADLCRWGVNTKFLHVEPKWGTPMIFQENYLDSKGRRRHRFSRTCPTSGKTLPAYRPLLVSDAYSISTTLPSHSVFYFDRVAPGTLALAQKSRENGALIVFEPSGIKDEALFAECLNAAHIFKYANDRVRGVDGLVANTKVLIEIETLGVEGLQLRVRRKGRMGPWEALPAYLAPELRDAAGSGDWTTAGIIHSLMANYVSAGAAIASIDGVAHAVRLGQILAALNCQFDGARGLMYNSDASHVLEIASTVANEASTLGTVNLIHHR